MITLEDVEKALNYLGGSDENYAMAKARFIYEGQNIKTVRSLAFLEASTGTVADRTACSETSEAYRAALSSYRDSAYEYERLRAKRLTAELQIELWRSISSARNHGQMV